MEKKINITLGALLALSAAPGIALADAADNFAGANLSLGFGAQSSTFKTREQGAGIWNFGDGAGGGSDYTGDFSYDRQKSWPNDSAKFGGKMEFGYNFKVGKNFLLGASLAGDFNKLFSGKESTSLSRTIDCGVTSSSTSTVNCDFSSASGGIPETPSTGGFTDDAALSLRSLPTKMTSRNRYGIALRPMFMVTDQTAVYVKYSYNAAEVTGIGSPVNVHGPGFGVGFETNLSRRWFMRAEIETISYSGSRSDRAATIDVTGSGDATTITTGPASTGYTSGKYSANLKSTLSSVSIGFRF